MRDRILCGNSVKLLKKMPDSSVDLVLTSPPYFQQRTYHSEKETGREKTIESYLDSIMTVFRECVRIINDDGSIVINMGDKYMNGSLSLIPYRFAILATDTEHVKLVNDITWVKTNPVPRQFGRRLVNSTEPFFHFVKSDDYYYDPDSFQPVKKHEKIKKNTRVKSTVGDKYRLLIDQSDLTNAQKSLAVYELNKVISETVSGEISGFRMKIKGIHSLPFGGQSGGRLTQMNDNGFTIIKMRGKSLKRDVIIHSVENLKWNNHPAVYPEYITEQMILLLTQRNGMVLDPYVGSGTTCVSARKLGRRFIGIDINHKFCSDARKRVRVTKTI